MSKRRVYDYSDRGDVAYKESSFRLSSPHGPTCLTQDRSTLWNARNMQASAAIPVWPRMARPHSPGAEPSSTHKPLALRE